MTSGTQLEAVIAALEQANRLLELQYKTPVDPEVQRIHARRRRASAMLRAVLRWHHTQIRPEESEIMRKEEAVAQSYLRGQSGAYAAGLDRRLIAIYETAIAATASDAPEYRLLKEQRDEAEQAYETLRRHAQSGDMATGFLGRSGTELDVQATAAQ
ncbi:hypothetical protein FGG78_24950 [Thioclava sp. BHET1]|nr:hypothetical protein FGG78_24950 [Thioclava sp. BHET1]